MASDDSTLFSMTSNRGPFNPFLQRIMNEGAHQRMVDDLHSKWRDLALSLVESIPHDHSQAMHASSWGKDDEGRVKVTHYRDPSNGNCPRCKLDREVERMLAEERALA